MTIDISLKFKEHEIKETGWNEGTSDEEAGSDAICLLVFRVGGFWGMMRGAATTVRGLGSF